MGCFLGKIRVGDRQLVEAQGRALRQYATLYLMGIPASGTFAIARCGVVGGRVYGRLAFCHGCASILNRFKRELPSHDRPASVHRRRLPRD